MRRFPTTDDLAFVNSAYPPKTGALSFGTISGTITAAGAVPVPFALLTFVDTTNGYTVGGLAAADGTYSVQVLPGNYIVYAEPFNAIVQAGNLYLTAAQAALAVPFSARPCWVGSQARRVWLLRLENTSTANISVTLGATAFKLPYYGFGRRGQIPATSALSHRSWDRSRCRPWRLPLRPSMSVSQERVSSRH